VHRTRLIRELMLCLLLTTLGYAAPVHLRCEYRDNPLGIDVATPRLSWQSNDTERDWHQSAFQILVATSPAKLQGAPDVWDSGKQSSAESVGIPYGGPMLESRKRYYWTVRVWDSNGKPSEATTPAWWEMALLRPADWSAKWITWKNPEEEADRAAIRWVWLPGQNFNAVPVDTTAVFRVNVEVSAKPRSAVLFAAAIGNFQARVNGQAITSKQNWHEFDRHDIGHALVVGNNTLEVTVKVPEPRDDRPNAGTDKVKAALAALVKITQADGSIVRPSPAHWAARWAMRRFHNPPRCCDAVLRSRRKCKGRDCTSLRSAATVHLSMANALGRMCSPPNSATTASASCIKPTM
jgi:alpha-L-rhamnosidase